MGMIEQHYLDLLETDGFIQRYFDLLIHYGKCEATYEAVERQHEMAFNKRKYSDYDSFKVQLSKWSKKKREK